MYIFLILLLFLATITDLIHHKIPNAISLGGIAAGLICQAWFMGTEGLLNGFLGLLVGLSLFLPLYALRAMAAGDVKLMAMVGTFLAPREAIVCVAFTLILGMIIAIAYVAISGKGLIQLRRYKLIAKTLLTTGEWIYIPPDSNDGGAVRFPYALAILTGTVIGLWYMDIAIINFI